MIPQEMGPAARQVNEAASSIPTMTLVGLGVLVAVAVLVVIYLILRYRPDFLRVDVGSQALRNKEMMAQIDQLKAQIIGLEAQIDMLLRQLLTSEGKSQQSEEKARAAAIESAKQAEQIRVLREQLEAKKLIAPVPPAPSVTKVLMVAPRSNLPMVDAETQDVLRSGLSVTPLFSPIAQVTLTREIRGGNYDGLWLAGHMDKEGNFLLDGEVLPASALTALVRGRFNWIFLNSCQSIIAAQMLQNETDCDLICTILDVPDVDAYRTGSLFASALARTGDTRVAYEQSRPGNNRIYLYLAGSRKKG